ncbi:hypothetical protein OGAPHI_001074 [Ogataea philodendri]|uniref:Uncharacterized protein n=1 Tax=Ogataea philodendri TaxID=1378263 RepID=A0A9P8PG03_9ASCO|nr:uncharacterized protein OGAPHI_001074 [Ogataea philodendri]KAH3670559.1 hypothetical protein OGAPHI_001074 [Ogataea philodendri]
MCRKLNDYDYLPNPCYLHQSSRRLESVQIAVVRIWDLFDDLFCFCVDLCEFSVFGACFSSDSQPPDRVAEEDADLETGANGVQDQAHGIDFADGERGQREQRAAQVGGQEHKVYPHHAALAFGQLVVWGQQS